MHLARHTNIFQPELRWSALFTLSCTLQNDLGQGVLAEDVAIPSQLPSLDRGKELSLPASVVGGFLSM